MELDEVISKPRKQDISRVSSMRGQSPNELDVLLSNISLSENTSSRARKERCRDVERPSRAEAVAL